MTEMPKEPFDPMPGSPARPSISEAIATLRAQKPAPVKTDDPAPSPMKVHQEKMEAIVRAATAAVLDTGRQMRDQLDEALKVIIAESDRVLDQIADYVGKTDDVQHNFKVMRDALDNVEKQMNPTIINPPAKRNSGGKS